MVIITLITCPAERLKLAPEELQGRQDFSAISSSSQRAPSLSMKGSIILFE